jgi:glutathione S-transferase
LTAKYDPEHKVSFAYDTPEYWDVVEWLVWMQSGLGPMQGQANHFYRYAPEKIEYGIKRYQNETLRLYSVLEDRLKEQQAKDQCNWLVGGRYTIADLCSYSWVNWAPWAGIDTSPFPNLEKWVEAIDARPATNKGLNLTNKFDKREKFGDKDKMEREAKKSSEWIIKANKADFEK